MLKRPPEISEENRTKTHSEYYIRNFSYDDTKEYLNNVNRADIDPEKLYLALNRAVLNLDLINDEIFTGVRCNDKFNEHFKNDLAEIKKHTRKLCKILGVEKDGDIKRASGSRALHTNTQSAGDKPNSIDNLYWGLTSIALSNSEWIKSANNLKTLHDTQSFAWPAFADRIKIIGQEINFLNAISEKILDGLQNDRLLMDFEYYRDGIDFGLTGEQWLIGRKLPEIYKEFFGKPLPISGPKNKKPHGEGVDFLMWCLDRVGLNYKRSTVVRYYYDYRIETNS